MTISEKQAEIIEEFEIYEDWLEKYEYIIELGKDTPKLEEQFRTKDNIIEGCQSQVWLHSEEREGRLFFSADSDAIITKGIIGLLVRVFNGEKAEDIAKSDLQFIQTIGLMEHLSPTRANGLASMVKKIKTMAISAVK